MHAAVVISFAALAVAQRGNREDAEPYTPSYSNPNTQYLSQTNSLGVVTGQPTYIPAVVTELPTAATSPAGPNYPDTPEVDEDATSYGNPRSTGRRPSPTGIVVYPSGESSSPAGGVVATASSGGSRPSGTPSGYGSDSTPTPGSDSDATSSGGSSDESSSTSTSSGSSASSSEGAAPCLQIGSGLLGAVGVVFAAFL